MKLFYSSVLLLLIPALFSCNNTHIFSKKNAKQIYADKLKTFAPARAAAWLSAGKFALQHPLTIPSSYIENGILYDSTAQATGFSFDAITGQQINIRLTETKGTNFTTYLELWKINGYDTSLVILADTSTNSISSAVLSPAKYIVRMQPEIGAKGSYQLEIYNSPLFSFPIDTQVSSRIISFWGDDRDAGVRKHEGIDISAKKGSNIVACTDGIVTNVEETDIGGKVVSFRPDGYYLSLYHAHMDTQFVHEGQRVKAGDPLGTVGNTGNAKNTIAHLHFGIYTNNGAINPLTFVQKITMPAAPPEKILSKKYTLTSKTKLYPAPEKKNAYQPYAAMTAVTEAYTNNYYRVKLANGAKGFVWAGDLK